MIPGTGAGGDTSSEGSVTELAIPHHVPHVLPPPPQMIAPAPPAKRSIRKPSNKLRHQPRKVVPVVAPGKFLILKDCNIHINYKSSFNFKLVIIIFKLFQLQIIIQNNVTVP